MSGPGVYLEKPVRPESYVDAVRLLLGMQSVEASAAHPEKLRAEAEVRRYIHIGPAAELPEKFRGVPPGSVHDYLATLTRNHANLAKVVKDAEAETGIATKLDLTDKGVESPEKYALPMPWGVYATDEKRVIGSNAIRRDDIPGPGYHWYRMGAFAIPPDAYVYFLWSWIIQVDVQDVFDPAKPEQKFEVWARIKFEGPRFPHARPTDQDAVSVERLVLVKNDP